MPYNAEQPSHPPEYTFRQSLLTAEEVSVSALTKRINRFKDHSHDTAKMRVAWLLIERAFATPHHDDEADFDQAFARFQEIADRPNTTVHNPLVFSARLALAYEDAFKNRARHLPETPEVIAATRNNIGSLLEELAPEGSVPNDKGIGNRAELVAAYGYLRGGWLPYLASEREECNEYIADNHDFYLLSQRKLPLQVKNKKCTGREKGPDPDMVLVVKITPTLMPILRHIPQYKELFSMPKSERQKAALVMLTKLQIADYRQETLEQHEIELLKAFTNSLKMQAIQFLAKPEKGVPPEVFAPPPY